MSKLPTDNAMFKTILDKINSVEEKVGTLDKKVDILDKKIDTVDKKVDILDQKVDILDSEVMKNTKRLDKLGLQLARLEDDAPTIQEFYNLEKRVRKLEKQSRSN